MMKFRRSALTHEEMLSDVRVPVGSVKHCRLCLRKSKGKNKVFEAKDAEWHLKNCLDSQFDPWREFLQGG